MDRVFHAIVALHVFNLVVPNPPGVMFIPMWATKPYTSRLTSRLFGGPEGPTTALTSKGLSTDTPGPGVLVY